MTADSVTVSLANVSQVEPRTVLLQGGAYGEHQFLTASDGKTETPVNGSCLTVRLEPGCGTRLRLAMKRFANPPTLSFPWER